MLAGFEGVASLLLGVTALTFSAGVMGSGNFFVSSSVVPVLALAEQAACRDC